MFYRRTGPPVFSTALKKKKKNPVQSSQNKSPTKAGEESWRERMEKHTELHKHFNFQMNAGDP